MSSSLASNWRTTIRSALPPVQLSTRSTWAGFRSSLSRILNAPGSPVLARDHPTYCDLATDCQQRAYDIVREHHALTVSRVERRISVLSDAQRAVSKFAVGGWVWVYNTAATIRQGAKTDTDAKVLKAKLSIKLTGPYKVLVVGPCTPANTPDCSPLGAKLLYLDLTSDMPGADARRRVSVQRCKPCANPHDHGDMPKYLLAMLTQYVFNNFSKKSPPHHVTQDDVSITLQGLEVENITGHQ